MQNLTRLLKKINKLWNQNQSCTLKSTHIKKFDKFIILLVCVIISVISSYEFITNPIENINLIFFVFINFLEILICCGILLFISKNEEPFLSSRQIFLLIGLLLFVQILKINFKTISPLSAIVPPTLIISQGIGTITALSWVAIAFINWPDSPNGMNEYLLLITFISSCLVAIFGGKIRNRAQLLQVSILVPLLAFIGQCLFLGIDNNDLYKLNIENLLSKQGTIVSDSLLLAILMLLTIILMPILESIFGLVTKARLLELADQEKPLLRRLSIEAPGTFEHTLLLCGLAEEATRMIGGNVDLVRTGALYHDIGKLHAPNWFIENQNGKNNPHDELDNPYESAKILQDHVDKGIQIAKKYRLPKPIINFIPEHQGTLKMGYFLFKAKEKNKNVEESDFKYKGPIPQSKETAILMLADGCEAALRAMDINATDKEALKIISKIINSRIGDGQLLDINFKRGEIFLIKISFLNVWKRVRHRRIQYPSAKNNTFS